MFDPDARFLRSWACRPIRRSSRIMACRPTSAAQTSSSTAFRRACRSSFCPAAAIAAISIYAASTTTDFPKRIRRPTSFQLSTLMTEWADQTTAPTQGPLFQAALGATPQLFTGGTVASVTSQTEIQFSAAHGLTPGQAITFGGEIRFPPMTSTIVESATSAAKPVIFRFCRLQLRLSIMRIWLARRQASSSRSVRGSTVAGLPQS